MNVGGLDYWAIKKRIMDGKKVTEEQAQFVGFTNGKSARADIEGSVARDWLQPTNPSNIDKRLEELARLRDLAPNYITLARRIVEEKSQ
jgi:hypothetical protein